jgi:glutamate racemase
MTDIRPIGIFDSGVGGLTVLRAIYARLPAESTMYVGDLAHFPYGLKPANQVRAYAHRLTAYLLSKNVKAIVVACNTATALALPELEAWASVPTIGVVVPGVEAALARSRVGRIGVLATEGTVRSRAYVREIVRRCTTAVVHQRAASNLVEAIEHGLAGTVQMEQLVWPPLSELLALGCDTIILGCTHFPLIRHIFERLAGPEIAIVDSAATTAAALASRLAQAGCLAPPTSTPRHTIYVTAEAATFAQQARTLFGQPIQAHQLDLEWPKVHELWRATGSE